VTLARTAAVIALAALVFAAAYLITSSGGEQAGAQHVLRELSFPAPAVALPPAGSAGLPSLAPAPPRVQIAPPPAPVPGPAPAPQPGPAPAPPPGPPPASDIIEG
jgi:hypothetical protein